MKRCIHCHRRIWPWDHYGWLVGEARTDWWHTRCLPDRHASPNPWDPMDPTGGMKADWIDRLVLGGFAFVLVLLVAGYLSGCGR